MIAYDIVLRKRSFVIQKRYNRLIYRNAVTKLYNIKKEM